MPTIEIREDGLTVDLVCWRHYGREAGTTEIVLDRNPGLAALGHVLPPGTRLVLPELPTRPATRPTRSLWD